LFVFNFTTTSVLTHGYIKNKLTLKYPTKTSHFKKISSQNDSLWKTNLKKIRTFMFNPKWFYTFANENWGKIWL